MYVLCLYSWHHVLKTGCLNVGKCYEPLPSRDSVVCPAVSGGSRRWVYPGQRAPHRRRSPWSARGWFCWYQFPSLLWAPRSTKPPNSYWVTAERQTQPGRLLVLELFMWTEWICMCVRTHNHAASGLQTPQRVFGVDLVREFSLHQRLLFCSIPHTHFNAAGLQTDTDLRAASGIKIRVELQAPEWKQDLWCIWGGRTVGVFTWRPLTTVLGTTTRTSTSV